MPLVLADNPRTAINAAIRRATFAAHKAVEQLDAEALRDLERIYRAAADDIAGRIAQHAGPDGNLALQEMRSALAQIEARLRELGKARDTLLDASLGKAADLGVRPFAAGAGVDAMISSPASMRIANEALDFIRNFVAEDGLQLSDRIWRLDRGARDAVINAIEQAVIRGHGASQAAAEFLARGVPVPIDVRDKINAANAVAIARDTTMQLLTGAGNPMDEARRLFRTEINRAHGEAYMKGGENHPDFAGWRYLLSPAHPKPDICDLLSAQNLYGLGPGVYPSREKCPWPAHPNTLSFIVIVFKDEITANDRSGKETPLDALKRLTPEQQRGVLGQGKSEIFEKGKLTQGMIRTPLRSVKKRIGEMPPSKPPAPQPATFRKPKTLEQMIEAGGLKVDELLQKMEATRIPAKNRFPETLYHDLKRVRPLDAEAMIASGGRGAELVRAASRFFPDDWTKRTDRLGRLETRYSNSRSWYKGYPDGAGAMQVRNFSAALHEYTHRMQQAMPELDDFFQDLHHSRTAGDPIKQLRDLIPRSGYGSHEVTREDKYAHPYQGRIYSGSRMTYLGKYGALEVMTMAFEDVLGGDPRRLDDLMKRDREMLNLVIGLLYHYVP